MMFGVVGRPACARRSVAILAGKMNSDREIVSNGGLEHWPVASAAQRFNRSPGHRDLNEIGVARPSFDFSDGRFRILALNVDRSLEATFSLGPLFVLPVAMIVRKAEPL